MNVVLPLVPIELAEAILLCSVNIAEVGVTDRDNSSLGFNRAHHQPYIICCTGEFSDSVDIEGDFVESAGRIEGSCPSGRYQVVTWYADELSLLVNPFCIRGDLARLFLSYQMRPVGDD